MFSLSERFLSAMHPQMPGKGRGVVEASSAKLTLKRLLSRVDASVRGEARRLREGLPAHGALVWLLTGVDSLMLDEAGRLDEGPLTPVTLERLFLSMHPPVEAEG